MPRITVIQVVYNNRRFIEPVFSAIFNQTFKDFQAVAVIAGNQDGGKEFLAQKFPQVEIIDPGYNIGFAAGHNLVFSKYQSEFFQLVNPDLVMEPDYIERLLKAFDDPKVGAATGKLYQWNTAPMAPDRTRKVLDTTGLVFNKSGRVLDRGQHDIDCGQFDGERLVPGVCAAGAMYRRATLEKIKESSGYFDGDFNTTYEDVDLSWRMDNYGWKNIFMPSAVAFHARGAAGTVGGYKKVFAYIKYHKKLSSFIRKYSYQNHIFAYIKNSRRLHPQFFVREFFMLGYIILFEIGTLTIVPNMLKLLPKMWHKRKLIKQLPSNA
ncbi:MAG: glycosyltransferase family 2 protein [Patescibacteria group bacterium]|nr:glycosyltransferase family 2 protein [Patescibacteria group bacterium]